MDASFSIDAGVKAQRKLAQRLGFWWTWGAIVAVACALLWLIATSFIQVNFLNRWRAIDATDADWRHRSGFELMTDHGTGCEYLKAGDAIIPRLNAAGQPICGKAR